MSSFAFTVGEAVSFVRSDYTSIVKGEVFDVARVLPPEGVRIEYRLKSRRTGQERVAQEYEIQKSS